MTETRGIVRRIIRQFEATNATCPRPNIFTKLTNKNNSIKRIIENFEAVNVNRAYNSKNKLRQNKMITRKTIINETLSRNLPIKFRPNAINTTELHSSPVMVSNFISNVITKSLRKHGQKHKEILPKHTNKYSNLDSLAGNVKRLTEKFETYLISTMQISNHVKCVIDKFKANNMTSSYNSKKKCIRSK